MFAVRDWNYYWLDELRAFLSADRIDQRPIYVKFTGDPLFYGLGKAVYGTKDAPRDYHEKVDMILTKELVCERLNMCSCIYVKRSEEDITVVFDYVDDFIFGGSSENKTMELINEFRKYAKTDDPVANKSPVLGMEIERVREKKLILVRMTKKIQELADRFPKSIERRRNVPMPTSGFVVREHEVEKLPENKRRKLTLEEISEYMSIIGSLIWIQGIRLDIIFAVLYLSWHTKEPLQHHMDMAYYVMGYLYTTIDLPLVLGGDSDISVQVYFDSSHGTGPRSRSISGIVGKLNEKSGAVFAKAHAQSTVKLSSFETELDMTTSGFKAAARLQNILSEIGVETSAQPTAFNDNQAMIEFVKGEGMAKGVRHMELRMWYTREEYQMGKIRFEYMDGKVIPADKLTKLGYVADHRKFAKDIMGLTLLDHDFFGEN
jgi:hypothetical protein